MMIAIYQANPAGVRRQHQCVARRRDAAPARVRRLRHVGDDRRQRRGAAADGRVAEPRAARRPAAALAAGRDAVARAPAPAPSRRRRHGRRIATCGRAARRLLPLRPAAEESQRLLELRNAELQNLQAGSGRSRGARGRAAAEAEVCGSRRRARIRAIVRRRGARCSEPAEAGRARSGAGARCCDARATEPSLVSQAIGWLLSPLLWIGLGVAALLLTALWFVRRRRQETEDVTGRWEALESETDDDHETRDATERMRRQLPEQTIVVEEQHAERAAPGAPNPRRSRPRAGLPRRGRSGRCPRRRNALEPNGHQSRPGRRRRRGRLPHRLRPLRPGCRARAEGARGGARSARPQAQAARGLFHVGQQGLVPQSGPEPARRHRPRPTIPTGTRSSSWASQICPDERLFTEATTGGRSRRRRSRSRRFAARSRVRRCIGRRGGRGEHGSRSRTSRASDVAARAEGRPRSRRRAA